MQLKQHIGIRHTGAQRIAQACVNNASFVQPKTRVRRWLATRRGVAAVLAMMFLILFGSLSVAMAIASQGNLTTAATHLHVSRAHAAAETGLAVARARLSESAARFMVSNSDVTQFGWGLWNGSMSGVGNYQVIAPATGRQDMSPATSLVGAIAQAHALDQDVVTQVGVTVPTIGNRPANASATEFQATHWLFTPAVAIEPRISGNTIPPLSYSITYVPLANGRDVRVVVTGYDFAYTRGGQPITRTLSQDFRMIKRVNHAIISPSRIMIGSNVLVSGDLGARFTGVTFNDGDPLLLRSDFVGKNATLDVKLNAFFAQLTVNDTDSDNRLRVNHPIEGAGIPSNTTDYDNDGQPDNAFADVTGDGFVDEFDIFIKHYDRNNDGRLVLSSALTAGTSANGLTPEFTDDNDLSLLIDSSNPDRNRNRISGYVDANSNGQWDAGEVMLDFDSITNTNRDQVLGFRDGFIDRKDQYAKVNGRLVFRTTESAWTSAQGSNKPKLRGPIIPRDGNAPQSYNVGNDVLPDLSAAVFDSSRTDLMAAADGQTFARQVALQLGVAESALSTYVEVSPANSSQPRYLRLDPDNDNDGLPDNYGSAYFEKMPFNSPNFSDYYYRPVYENMVFKDTVIPAGTNALFRNCTFVGVTYCRTNTTNTHVLWGEYGKLAIPSGQARPIPSPTRYIYGDNSGETSYPSMLPSTATPPTRMIIMATQPLDKADIPANQVAFTTGYSLLPDPLIISGLRVTDTKLYSNNIRFHDCLFVGSIVADSPTEFTQSRNKVQFTGSTRFAQKHPTQPDNTALNPESADRAEIAKSSMMLPNYSVDIGSFNSPASQNIQLKGAIIAGILDARGNTDIDGALLLTFTPTAGQGPLRDSLGNPVGNPAGFNTTIGYFGPDDGDSESLDPALLPTVGGVKIVGWDTNADGLADVAYNQAQPPGSTAVPFVGLGRIQLRFDPNMTLPNGIMLPMQFDTIPASYREGISW